MQNQGHIAGGVLDGLQHVETEAGPVCGVLTVDVADAGSQHGNAQIRDQLALCGISTLAAAHNAVFLTADSANLCFQGQTLLVADVDQLSGLCQILLDGIVGTVEHYGREACFDASLGCLIGTMVQVQSNGNRDLQILQHTVYHTNDGGVAAHILAGTLGYAENYGGLQLLCGEQNGLGPFQVVDVELTNGVVTFTSLGHHFFSRNEHCGFLRVF